MSNKFQGKWSSNPSNDEEMSSQSTELSTRQLRGGVFPPIFWSQRPAMDRCLSSCWHCKKARVSRRVRTSQACVGQRILCMVLSHGGGKCWHPAVSKKIDVDCSAFMNSMIIWVSPVSQKVQFLVIFEKARINCHVVARCWRVESL